MLFEPAVLALSFSIVFSSIPGLAVVYAPHVLAFGLLARLSPDWPRVFFIAGGLLGLLFYSPLLRPTMDYGERSCLDSAFRCRGFQPAPR